MTAVLHEDKSFESLEKDLGGDAPYLRKLFVILRDGNLKARKKAVTVLAHSRGISDRQISKILNISREATKRYWTVFASDPRALFAPRKRSRIKMDDPTTVEAVVSTLHSPPRAHGLNRTTWKQPDLQRVLREKGINVTARTIRAILKKQGFRWRKARKVLTSRDPDYREKVEKIKAILGNLGPNERFFSIDEFGPFAITIRGGRKLVAPGEEYTVPQWQKSKGSLIVTAALELSTNQVTHFYSKRKNTDEMIRLMDVLVKENAGMQTIYLSWDAASWHLSKKFAAKVAEINALRQTQSEIPRVELAPLPSGAQFLNVIESVFSGMARAIIHNSDYQSEVEAMQAIDRYYADRNAAFKENPKQAGNKIWGKERVTPEFAESNNCKDPNW